LATQAYKKSRTLLGSACLYCFQINRASSSASFIIKGETRAYDDWCHRCLMLPGCLMFVSHDSLSVKQGVTAPRSLLHILYRKFLHSSFKNPGKKEILGAAGKLRREPNRIPYANTRPFLDLG